MHMHTRIVRAHAHTRTRVCLGIVPGQGIGVPSCPFQTPFCLFSLLPVSRGCPFHCLWSRGVTTTLSSFTRVLCRSLLEACSAWFRGHIWRCQRTSDCLPERWGYLKHTTHTQGCDLCLEPPRAANFLRLQVWMLPSIICVLPPSQGPLKVGDPFILRHAC